MLLLDLAQVFTLLFVTLGPVKLLAPFAQTTHGLDDASLKRVAVLTTAIGTLAAVTGGLLGSALLESWHISIAAITLGGALIFLLVGLRLVLESYSATPRADVPPLPSKPMAAACKLAFPLVVTPYGLAAVIALLGNSLQSVRTVEIVAVLIGVMVLNLLSMMYIRHIMQTVTVVILQILGAMLAVLQVALAIQFMLRGLREVSIG